MNISRVNCLIVRQSQNYLRLYSSAAGGSPKSPPSQGTQTAAVNSNVPGLSANCVKSRSQPLGPGAAVDGVYKVPEYYCFDRMSYAEAEIEMAKYRCPQPSANRK